MHFDIESIRKNYEDIKKDIDEHSSHKERVTLVAASKYVDAEGIKALVEAGVEVCGENRVQAMRDKRTVLEEEGKEDIVKWHFIGNLQKNKIKYIIDYVELFQSVHSLSLLKELDKKAANKGKTLDVLLEVNISGEESKHGFSSKEVIENADEIKKLENVNIKGLMTMAPFTGEEAVVRSVFSGLRTLKDQLNEGAFEGSLTELSMGMSNDYQIALEEGATIIRVGSKLFEDRR